ncbi:MAG TPA: hypothetical protein VEH05_02845 [Streptosporangiaceae bacterium]|nr:hypothetical protein [Streptosporangiaceae bacterium]
MTPQSDISAGQPDAGPEPAAAAADEVTGDRNAATMRPLAPSGPWHDIQAVFVDDPRRSVRMAAEEVETALAALVASLRQRQVAVAPDNVTAGSADTERLLETLRSCRAFWIGLHDLSRRLTDPDAVGR